MRMICPQTFAEESLAVNTVDSLELDSSVQNTGQISRVSGCGLQHLVVKFPCGLHLKWTQVEGPIGFPCKAQWSDPGSVCGHPLSDIL